jgi:prepilin-type N-terminal cleavage/methylation domain-containing protein
MLEYAVSRATSFIWMRQRPLRAYAAGVASGSRTGPAEGTDVIRTTGIAPGCGGGRNNAERGLTLIELLIVLAIISILVAIAVATYAGQERKAHDVVAKGLVRSAMIVMETAYTGNRAYDTIAASDLAAIEPSLVFVEKPAETGAGSASNPNGSTDRADGKTAYFSSAGPQTYAVGARSAGGSTFGASVDRSTSHGVIYYINGSATSTW